MKIKKLAVFVLAAGIGGVTAAGAHFSVSPRESANQKLIDACLDILKVVSTDPSSIQVNRALVGDQGVQRHNYVLERNENSRKLKKELYKLGFRDHLMKVAIDYSARNGFGGMARDAIVCEFLEQRSHGQLYAGSKGRIDKIVIGNDEYSMAKTPMDWILLIVGNKHMKTLGDVSYSWTDRWRYWIAKIGN